MGKIKNAVKAVAVGSAKLGVGLAVPPIGAAIMATDACKAVKKVSGKDCGKVGTAVAIAATITGTNL